tara:strand:- start:11815 stop:12120 length:306 start_codon:yes stop_codon:yes gene_type:complete
MSVSPAIPRSVFENCVRDEVRDYRGEQPPLRLAKAAVLLLQEESELYLSSLLKAAHHEATERQQRKTVLLRDLHVVVRDEVLRVEQTPDTILSLDLEMEEE